MKSNNSELFEVKLKKKMFKKYETKYFPYRKSNPGLLGESEISEPLTIDEM